MKGLFVAGAAAILIIGTAAHAFAQSSGSSEKITPGHEMQERGSVRGSPGASGYAPGHREDRGTLRDRDDRTMTRDRD